MSWDDGIVGGTQTVAIVVGETDSEVIENKTPKRSLMSVLLDGAAVTAATLTLVGAFDKDGTYVPIDVGGAQVITVPGGEEIHTYDLGAHEAAPFLKLRGNVVQAGADVSVRVRT